MDTGCGEIIAHVSPGKSNHEENGMKSSFKIPETEEPTFEYNSAVGCCETEIGISLPSKLVEKRELICYDDLFSSYPDEENLKESVVADEDESSSEDEEDISSDSSDEASKEGLLKAALTPIENEIKGYDVTALPENGSQFLLKVAHERKLIPKIVNAAKALVEDFDCTRPVDESKPFKITKVPTCVDLPATLEQFLPTQLWTSIITHQFSNLSLKVEYWRAMMEDQGQSITLSERVLMPPADLNEEKCLLYCFGTKLYKQLKSNPRQRKGVSSADDCVILTFFCDEVFSSPPMNSEVNQDMSNATAEKVSVTEDLFKNLAISKEDDTETEAAEVAEVPSSSVDLLEQSIIEETQGQNRNNIETKSASVSSDSEDELEEVHFCEKQPPLMSILLNLSIPDVEDLLAMHILWLNKYGWFHELQGQWIYALLGSLVRPLSCDVVANIRKLVRICCHQRKRVCECKTAYPVPMVTKTIPSSKSTSGELVDPRNPDSEPSASQACVGSARVKTVVYPEDEDNEESIRFKEFVNTMNLFICLASNYFQQYDLADTPRS